MVPDIEMSATPVDVKAALVDPETLTVLWLNESAAQTVRDAGHDPDTRLPLSDVVPMADALHVPEAVREASSTGTPQHMRADLVGVTQPSIAIIASLYRMPDGNVLILTDIH